MWTWDQPFHHLCDLSHCCYCQWSSQIHSCSFHSTCSLLCIRFCHLYRVYHVWLFRCFRAFTLMPSYKSSANWNNCGFLPHRLHSTGFLYILHLRLQHTWWSCLVVNGITDKMDNTALYLSLEQDFGKIIWISSLNYRIPNRSACRISHSLCRYGLISE